MIQERHAVPFRWVLPISQIVLCAVALWPLRASLAEQVRHSMEAYRNVGTAPKPVETAPEPFENQQFPILIITNPLTPEEQNAVGMLEEREWAPMLLNLPLLLVQLPYVILNPAKQEWVPRGMDFKTWRVISWPLLGILFWWSAGRGMEALVASRRRLAKPRISWFETAVGAALFLFCGVASVALPLCTSHDEDFPMKLWVLGSAIWAVLGGVMVAARLAQWRIRKREPATAVGASPA